MPDEKPQTKVDRVVRVGQIIVAALCMGILMFGTMAVVMGQNRDQPELGVLTVLALGAAVVGAAMNVIVPRAIVASQRRKMAQGEWPVHGSQQPVAETDAGKLAAVYQTKTIVGCALLEGPCFLALAGFMVEGHVLSLVIAALLLVGVLAHFPTLGRATEWVTEQLRLLDEQRQFSA